jgi:glycosyltransferase involved in cell wall biosynthesis
MKIGFVLDEFADIGGGFQQSLSTIVALSGLKNHRIIVLSRKLENIKTLSTLGIEAHHYRFPFYRRKMTTFLQSSPRSRRLFSLLPFFLRSKFGSFDHILDEHKIDLLVCFFLSPTPLFIDRHPFITTVYDLCHRKNCEFPEVSNSWEFEHRERIFHKTLPRSMAILASSRILADDVARYYSVDRARIEVLPFLPAIHNRRIATTLEVEKIRNKYGLDGRYIYYPAQFWAHKNHVYILEGLKYLEENYGVRLMAAFSGSDYGNRAHVETVIARLRLKDRVRILGFVPSEDVNSLYTGCEAVVMPTYFGPTNLPPLEAMAVGRPVIYSDTVEFRAELNGAALYCDLNDSRTLAKCLHQLLMNPTIAAKLNKSGIELLSSTTPADYITIFTDLLDRYEYLRLRWMS